MPNFNRWKINELFPPMTKITTWKKFCYLKLLCHQHVALLRSYEAYATKSQQDSSTILSAHAAINQINTNPICNYCHAYEKKQHQKKKKVSRNDNKQTWWKWATVVAQSNYRWANVCWERTGWVFYCWSWFSIQCSKQYTAPVLFVNETHSSINIVRILKAQSIPHVTCIYIPGEK